MQLNRYIEINNPDDFLKAYFLRLRPKCHPNMCESPTMHCGSDNNVHNGQLCHSASRGWIYFICFISSAHKSSFKADGVTVVTRRKPLRKWRRNYRLACPKKIDISCLFTHRVLTHFDRRFSRTFPWLLTKFPRPNWNLGIDMKNVENVAYWLPVYILSVFL